jgi:uncharacterized phage protein (TIGR01671 family)
MKNMRQIKFRAWKKAAKTMEVGNFALGANGAVHFSDGDFLGSAQIVLMQFTGLLDKNGKEIYEGDVVEYTPNPLVFPNTHEVYQAVWIRNGFAFRKDKGSFSPYLSEDKLQVIGNIYESPSLNTLDPAE